MKKHLLLVIAVLAVSTILLDACFKKGPGDPFVSFLSRKARLSGKWNCTKYEINGVDSTSYNFVNTTTTCMGDAKIMSLEMSKTHQFIFYFDHNGKFTLDSHMVIKFVHLPHLLGNGLHCHDTSYILLDTSKQIAGYWNFLSNVGQYKNKEAIVTYDPNKNAQGVVWHLYELKSKTLIIERTVIGDLDSIKKYPSKTYRWTCSKVK